ncbi:hypothetical protein GY45DRAFT_819138 [Cubamyces sp. BRFM 1775]|nr:hypothetical protein GY45DRAFT_819138 [Cubamyces sp. BRFM 1775]
MTVTHTYTQEELDELFAIGEAQGELDEFLAIGAAQEEPAQIVAIHEAQAQEEVIALEEAVAAALEQAAGSQAAAGENTGKTHDCEICGKSFSRRADRSRHVNSVHFKIKAHICPFLIQEVGKEKKRCGKAYAQKTSLEVHMLTQYVPCQQGSYWGHSC